MAKDKSTLDETLDEAGATLVATRGEAPNRVLILEEEFNKQTHRFTRWVEDPQGWLLHDGSRFILDVQIGRDNPGGKPHAAPTPDTL